jgi:hypothetical protein
MKAVQRTGRSTRAIPRKTDMRVSIRVQQSGGEPIHSAPTRRRDQALPPPGSPAPPNRDGVAAATPASRPFVLASLRALRLDPRGPSPAHSHGRPSQERLGRAQKGASPSSLTGRSTTASGSTYPIISPHSNAESPQARVVVEGAREVLRSRQDDDQWADNEYSDGGRWESNVTGHINRRSSDVVNAQVQPGRRRRPGRRCGAAARRAVRREVFAPSRQRLEGHIGHPDTRKIVRGRSRYTPEKGYNRRPPYRGVGRRLVDIDAVDRDARAVMGLVETLAAN